MLAPENDEGEIVLSRDRAEQLKVWTKLEDMFGRGGTVKVERVYQPGLPLVALDEELCEQAFTNLVQNAYEAMGSELRLSPVTGHLQGRALLPVGSTNANLP